MRLRLAINNLSFLLEYHTSETTHALQPTPTAALTHSATFRMHGRSNSGNQRPYPAHVAESPPKTPCDPRQVKDLFEVEPVARNSETM